jgi:hypothetical protein
MAVPLLGNWYNVIEIWRSFGTPPAIPGSPRYHFAHRGTFDRRRRQIDEPDEREIARQVTALWACLTYIRQCMVATFEGSSLKTSSFSVTNRAELSALEQGIRKADLLLSKVRDDRLRFMVELSKLKMIGRLLASRSLVPYRCRSGQPIRGDGGGFYPTVVRRRLS